jgi:hypothetical protein
MEPTGTDARPERAGPTRPLRAHCPKPFYNPICGWLGSSVRARVAGVLILLGLCYPLNWLLSVKKHLPYSDLYPLLGAFAVLFGFWALNRMYVRSLRAIDAIERCLPDANAARLAEAFRLVYSNRFLIPAGSVFGVLMTFQWSHFGLRLPVLPSLYIDTWVLLAGFVAGLGLWEATASMTLVRAMLPPDERYYFTLAPGRSGLVDEVSRLFLEYSIVFAVEVLPFSIGFALFSRSTQTLVSMGKLEANVRMLTTSAVLVMLILIVIMPLYFFMPQLLIRASVTRVKAKLAQQYQTRLNALLSRSEELTERELREFALLREAESELHNSASFPVSVTDMAKPFLPLLPSVGTLLASDAIMRSLKQALRQILPWL